MPAIHRGEGGQEAPLGLHPACVTVKPMSLRGIFWYIHSSTNHTTQGLAFSWKEFFRIALDLPALSALGGEAAQ